MAAFTTIKVMIFYSFSKNSKASRSKLCLLNTNLAKDAAFWDDLNFNCSRIISKLQQRENEDMGGLEGLGQP